VKKWYFILVMLVFFSGCSRQKALETVTDEWAQPVIAPHAQLSMWLPEEAVLETMDSETGSLYFCNGYTLTVQTLPSGDTEETLKSLTGFGQEALAPMETQRKGIRRLDWVWTTMGEDGQQVCRGALLDDGNYHYCVTTMTDAASAVGLEAQWSRIFGSMTLA
jgi:hypothetical protein